MTVRSDVSIDYEVSPRIFTVLSPSTEIMLQDIHDTLADLQDQWEGHQHPNLISSAGKEDLGGSVFVGITSTLQDVQVAFQARVTQLESGTATSADAPGTMLTDTTALFQTNLVARGDIVLNTPDGSAATVIDVLSETQLTHTALTGGAENDWDSGEAYIIWDEIQCNVSGGNLVAVDSAGDPLDPIFPTFGTQVIRTSSSSATLAQSTEIQEIHTRLGLEEGNAVTDTPTGIDSASGNIDIDRTGDGVTSSTLTRQP